MGKGIDLARGVDLETGGMGVHANTLDDFKDQLLIVFLKRLKSRDVPLVFSVLEVDNTQNDLVSFSVQNGVFNFVLSKKS
jgi:hypothetical protein